MLFRPKYDRTSTGNFNIPLIDTKLTPSVRSRQSTIEATTEDVEESSIRDWPRGPQLLRNGSTDNLIEALYDVLVVVLSLMFLIFGFIVRGYDHEPVAHNKRLTRDLIEATKYGPTIFPILFAGVVGRCLKGVLNWRLERGARLGDLDLLAGSYTLVSAITSQLSLRICTLTGPLLVILWALSPIGGQASLRVMTIGNATRAESVSFNYMTPNKSFVPFEDADDASEVSVADGLFIAALLSPYTTRRSSVDFWNNVKIPMIESFEAAGSPATDGWFTVPDDNVVYSSLIGLPISNMTYSGLNSSADIETSYWHLDCPILEDTWQPPNVNLSGAPWSGYAGTSGEIYSNRTTCPDYAPAPRDLTGANDYRTIVYNTWDTTTQTLKTGSICTIETTYVEAQVNCIGTICAVAQLRRSTLPHPISAWTFLDEDGCFAWLFFAEYFAETIVGHSATSTAAVTYFVDPQNPFNINSNIGLYTLGSSLYAQRFAQLLNTLWLAMAGMYAIAGGLDAVTASNNITQESDSFDATYLTTEGTRFVNEEVIICHQGWLAALTLASLAMVFASLAHPVLRLFRKAPDFTLNVSTMTRDNPYVPLPVGGSSLGSSQRARLLRRSKVRFGDVAPENDIGHMAVSFVNVDRSVTRARKDRIYD